MLAQMRAQNLTWKDVLAELIDNSFDAAASRVAVTIGPAKQLVVEDNGAGCDNIEAMLTIGRHYRQASTKLGRFGVGLKDAACWLWGTLKIVTVRKGTRLTANINWPTLLNQSDWEVPDPLVEPAAGGQIGTRLLFKGFERSSPADFTALVDEISYTFTPALIQGKQIVFNLPRKREVLAKPYVGPPLDDVIEDTLSVDGRTLRLRVGIVREGHPNKHPGFAYCHHHRIIKKSCAVGAGGRDTARIAGEVWLDNSWSLSKNKDDINEHLPDLGAAVFKRCEAILIKAEKQSESISSAALTMELTERVRVALQAACRKQKRSPPKNNTGTVEPKHTGRRVKNPRNTQPGDAMPDAEKLGSVRINWREFTVETLGEVDLEGSVIWLNDANQHLSGLRSRRNVDALLMCCIGMYVHAVQTKSECQKWLPGLPPASYESNFVALWSEVLKTFSGPRLAESEAVA